MAKLKEIFKLVLSSMRFAFMTLKMNYFYFYCNLKTIFNCFYISSNKICACPMDKSGPRFICLN